MCACALCASAKPLSAHTVLSGASGNARRTTLTTFPHLPRQVYSEGTHLMVPWFERPIIYDVRARPSLIQSTSGSKDLQMASCDKVVQRVGVTPGCILGVHI